MKKKNLHISIPDNDINKLHYSIYRTISINQFKLDYKNKEINPTKLCEIFKLNWDKEKKRNPVYIITK